ncbi:MAG: polyprenyl synthetase family protein [Chrysiogenales bacterium]|nr:MAG: polyprenyl synthetase family protein [Chrysiogenales bacterium]
MPTELKKILAPLDDYLARVEDAIEKSLRTGIPVIDESARHLFIGGGKRIRASLVILCSGLRGEVPDGIIELAAATEIVHSASLIHDDIIDQALIRRGNIDVPRKWGNKIAVLAGDYMYSVALSTAIQDGDPAIFPLMVNGTKDMVMGELCQIQYSAIDTATREQYLTIVELKTARFMGSCAKLGAVKSGLAPGESEDLYLFGLNIGFAFQIIDDTLDVMQDSDEVGKDVGSDFKDGKITLPFLRLIETGTEADLALLIDYKDNPDQEKWKAIQARLVESGAIEYSVRFASDHIDRAREIVMRFPDSLFRGILLDLSDFLLHRTH